MTELQTTRNDTDTSLSDRFKFFAIHPPQPSAEYVVHYETVSCPLVCVNGIYKIQAPDDIMHKIKSGERATSVGELEILTEYIEPYWRLKETQFDIPSFVNEKYLKFVIIQAEASKPKNYFLLTKLYSLLMICLINKVSAKSLEKSKRLMDMLSSVSDKCLASGKIAWLHLAHFYLMQKEMPIDFQNSISDMSYRKKMDSYLLKAQRCFQTDKYRDRKVEICILYWWRYIVHCDIRQDPRFDSVDWLKCWQKEHNNVKISTNSDSKYGLNLLNNYFRSKTEKQDHFSNEELLRDLFYSIRDDVQMDDQSEENGMFYFTFYSNYC